MTYDTELWYSKQNSKLNLVNYSDVIFNYEHVILCVSNDIRYGGRDSNSQPKCQKTGLLILITRAT